MVRVLFDVVPPQAAANIPPGRNFSRPNRKTVLANKRKAYNGVLETKTLPVTPGDIDPDGAIHVE